MDIVYTPAHLLNSYVWKALQVNLGMTTDDFNGMVPIIPAAQQPEFTGFEKPFIVYGYLEDLPEYSMYQVGRGVVIYYVYGNKHSDIIEVQNVIKESLERMDESARDINHWTSQTPAMRGINFTTTSIHAITSPEPESQEGGRHEALISIRIKYKTDYGVQTSFDL